MAAAGGPRGACPHGDPFLRSLPLSSPHGQLAEDGDPLLPLRGGCWRGFQVPCCIAYEQQSRKQILKQIKELSRKIDCLMGEGT